MKRATASRQNLPGGAARHGRTFCRHHRHPVATINNSIVLISLPAIFRGIKLNPLAPGNVSYLLWMLMGYMVVTAVLVVSLGRVGDMFGRVRMYNLGFSQSCPDPSRDSSAAACSPRLTGTWCSWQAR